LVPTFLARRAGYQYSLSPTSGIRSRKPIGAGFVLLSDGTAAIFALGLDAILASPDIDSVLRPSLARRPLSSETDTTSRGWL
jgi:hypothetical protein